MTSNEIMISGAQACSGSIQISGAKNAAFPLMAACLLTDEEVVLKNVPKITDVDVMKEQLESYGVRVTESGSRWVLRATKEETKSSPSSRDGLNAQGPFRVLGPLLARFKEAEVYYPGGCKIGGENGRPVDYHIDALKQMGARIKPNTEYVSLKADQGLRKAHIHFPQISVGATQNVIMAACLADGRIEITNAAVEPEIIDLIKMLDAMGMKGEIRVTKNRIVVNGRNGVLLKGCTHKIIPDRIEAGTWAIAAAMTGGTLLLEMDPVIGKQIMVPTLQMLQQAGVSVEWKRNGFEVRRSRLSAIRAVDITTGPFPEFPTDLLPQWVTFMTLANGPSVLKETIWNERFNHVPHLEKMGATFTLLSKRGEPKREYQVHGSASLQGKPVVATDLRAGVALILAGLAAKGTTRVDEFHHVLRGYENIKEKLAGCWGVEFRNLPQTRSGFHGGNRSQVRQVGPKQHDRQLR